MRKDDKKTAIQCTILFFLALLVAFILAQMTKAAPAPPINKRWWYAAEWGVPGDSTDVTTTMQAFFLKAAGNRIILDSNSVYYVTDSLFLPAGTELDMRGSKIHFEMSGTKKALIVNSNCRVYKYIVFLRIINAVLFRPRCKRGRLVFISHGFLKLFSFTLLPLSFYLYYSSLTQIFLKLVGFPWSCNANEALP